MENPKPKIIKDYHPANVWIAIFVLFLSLVLVGIIGNPWLLLFVVVGWIGFTTSADEANK